MPVRAAVRAAKIRRRREAHAHGDQPGAGPRFVLLQQGLLGGYRYAGKQGALDFVRHAGCIQFDPVDVCGKMAELTLQSRVKGFSKQQLNELLYEDSACSITRISSFPSFRRKTWPYYGRYREQARRGGEKFEGMGLLEEQRCLYSGKGARLLRGAAAVRQAVLALPYPLERRLAWGIQGLPRGARAVVLHGRAGDPPQRGTRKYYDLAQRHIPAQILQAPEPLPDDFDHQKWRVQNRIGAAGLVWDRASGYWNNVWGLTTDLRHKVIQTLLQEGAIASLRIQGLKPDFYYRVQDAPLLESACSGQSHRRRCELIAPLDPFLWDKPLTPSPSLALPIPGRSTRARRSGGTAPIRCPSSMGSVFAGRLEAVCDRETKTLRVRNIWYEDGVRQTKALAAALRPA